MKLIFEDEDGVLTSRNTGILYRVFPQADGTFFTPRLYPGSFETAEQAIEAIRKKYENA